MTTYDKIHSYLTDNNFTHEEAAEIIRGMVKHYALVVSLDSDATVFSQAMLSSILYAATHSAIKYVEANIPRNIAVRRGLI